jgi:transmembrane sensor
LKLEAGDEAQVVADGRVTRAEAPNVSRATAWRARKLLFPGDRIADVAAEFNRYNRTRIHVEGEALRNRRMSGVFDADDPSPFLEHLERDPDVRVESRGRDVFVRSRGD